MEIVEAEATTRKKSKAVRQTTKKVDRTGQRMAVRNSSSIPASKSLKSSPPTAQASVPADTFLSMLQKIDSRLDNLQADLNTIKDNQTRLEALITQSNETPKLNTAIAPSQPFHDVQLPMMPPVMPTNRVAGGAESDIEKYMKQMFLAKMFQNAFS
jgi:hypothetical protein